MRIKFSNNTDVTNHFHQYITHAYIFVYTITLLLLVVYLDLNIVNNASNTAFTTIVIFGQIYAGAMDLLY